MNKIEQCPGCKSKSYLQTGAKSPGFKVRINNKTFKQEKYFIKECQKCGLLYRSNCLTTKDFSKYYKEVDHRKWESEKYFPTERVIIKILQNLPNKSKILDFGCSSGRLLSCLVSTQKCFGFEINKNASKEAEKKGIKILKWRDLNDKKIRFDAILLVDVFEHLQKPTLVLANLIKQLKKRGHLLLVTGNADVKACRRDPSQFWYFRIIEHVIMLTKKYAVWLCEKKHLKIIKVIHKSHYDFEIKNGIKSFIKEWFFWRFRQGYDWEKHLYRLVPQINKSETWNVAPGNLFRKDHAVVVFQKM